MKTGKISKNLILLVFFIYKGQLYACERETNKIRHFNSIIKESGLEKEGGILAVQRTLQLVDSLQLELEV